MKKKEGNNIKLGLFVIAGLLFLVLLLYMIGKNRNLFGTTYLLKARFENVQGLIVGNNIRYSGIQAGTVSKIVILNDTTIEVSMAISTKMKNIIRKNAIASIGTDGLVGNKLVNIIPARKQQNIAIEGDIIFAKKAIDTDEILQTLYKTNNDIATITANLKTTVQRINDSKGLWALLGDGTIPIDVKKSIVNIKMATSEAEALVNNLNAISSDVKKGKGSVGSLLTDTSFSNNLTQAVLKISAVSNDADILLDEISKGVRSVKNNINNGPGPLNAALNDSIMVLNINKSLENIKNGSDGFNQNMEALKHNFLFKRYFKKLEKSKKTIK